MKRESKFSANYENDVGSLGVKEPIDYVPNNSRNHKINYALSNSFAFGGHNSTIVFKKYS